MCTWSSGKSIIRQAMVPVFAVPSRAWSTYLMLAADTATRPCTFGAIRLRMVPSELTIALPIRGS
jgi:hypothetical protein